VKVAAVGTFPSPAAWSYRIHRPDKRQS
jgi:hypothetical protein